MHSLEASFLQGFMSQQSMSMCDHPTSILLMVNAGLPTDTLLILREPNSIEWVQPL